MRLLGNEGKGVLSSLLRRDYQMHPADVNRTILQPPSPDRKGFGANFPLP